MPHYNLHTNSVLHFDHPFVVFSVALLVITVYLIKPRRSQTPKLRGPPSKSLIFGATQDLFNATDLGGVYEGWERSYGQVYEMPSGLGSTMVVVADPKAVAHVLSKDTVTYVKFGGAMIRRIFGEMMNIMEAEDHKRARRALSPVFSIAAIRGITDVFVGSVRKLQESWDSLLDNDDSCVNGSVIVDVQRWMNYFSLDSIGRGGFSHDFGALSGHQSDVLTAFDSWGSLPPSILSTIFFLLGPRLPFISYVVPSKHTESLWNLVRSIRVIAEQLLKKVDKETDPEMRPRSEKEVDRSVIGTLIKSKYASEKIRMTVEEIMGQNLMLIAGYEATSVTLTWALIELSRNPNVQDTLRAELRDNLKADQDPTYDQVHNDLPYLDAFICEVLRLHTAQPELTRVATSDDTISLTEPIMTASGLLTDTLLISKGTVVRVPLVGVNRSEVLWGKDAGKFDPQRWLSEQDEDSMKDVQGYRHMLTFSFGPRMCPGKTFALTELKVVISLLIYRYTFALPDGPETKLGSHRALLPRPKVAGEDGSRVPLVIRKAEL